MKVNKFNEEINTVNFSDLENWDIKKDRVYTGTKNLNLDIGQKVFNLLEEYGLLAEVGPGNFLTRQNSVLASEKQFREYRVHLSKIKPFNEYLDDEGIDDFDKLSKKEKIRIQKEYESRKIYGDTNLEFSVFLPSDIKSYDITNSALYDASNYLLVLSDCIPELFKGIEDNVLIDNTKGFKCFLNKKDLKITNDNIEDVPAINYRIYKDSKFFGELINEWDGNETALINDWLNLIK